MLSAGKRTRNVHIGADGVLRIVQSNVFPDRRNFEVSADMLRRFTQPHIENVFDRKRRGFPSAS